MLSQMVLSTVSTLGGATTTQAEMPFTMYLATAPEKLAQYFINNVSYDPKQQLSLISDVQNANSSSTCQKQSATTDSGVWSDWAVGNKDPDTDTQVDD
jgi:hypothetical protein